MVGDDVCVKQIAMIDVNLMRCRPMMQLLVGIHRQSSVDLTN